MFPPPPPTWQAPHQNAATDAPCHRKCDGDPQMPAREGSDDSRRHCVRTSPSQAGMVRSRRSRHKFRNIAVEGADSDIAATRCCVCGCARVCKTRDTITFPGSKSDQSLPFNCTALLYQKCAP